MENEDIASQLQELKLRVHALNFAVVMLLKHSPVALARLELEVSELQERALAHPVPDSSVADLQQQFQAMLQESRMA